MAARAQAAKSLRAHLRCPRELKLRSVLLAEVGRGVNEAQVKEIGERVHVKQF